MTAPLASPKITYTGDIVTVTAPTGNKEEWRFQADRAVKAMVFAWQKNFTVVVPTRGNTSAVACARHVKRLLKEHGRKASYHVVGHAAYVLAGPEVSPAPGGGARVGT